jgi:TolA-binding protein
MGEAYRAVIEKYPECPFVERASLELAELAFKRSELAKAAEYLELYLERSWEDDPRIPKALYDLGRAYEQMGEMGLAAEVYRIFIEADPNNPLAESIKVKLGEMERASE